MRLGLAGAVFAFAAIACSPGSGVIQVSNLTCENRPAATGVW
jgi:hypothetical protein